MTEQHEIVTKLTDDELAKELSFAPAAATKDHPLTMTWLGHLQAEQARRSGGVLTCPTTGQEGVAEADDLIGCGSPDIGGPDFEGMYDCGACGLFFVVPDVTERPVDAAADRTQPHVQIGLRSRTPTQPDPSGGYYEHRTETGRA